MNHSLQNVIVMELIDKLNAISSRVLKMKEQVETEEATKNAFVMPFIAALGYDVFNPTEVIPEFTADVGVKKGEKVDYCILRDGQPIIIIECKHWKQPLTNHNSQLHRYFHVTKARFSILTNGIQYRFYTDLDSANIMDEKPFLEFSIDNISDAIIHELRKFQKENFNVDEILNTASDLKYSRQIKDILSNELKEPSEEFTKFLAAQVYEGRLTNKVLDQFKELVKKSTKNLLSEMISERLKIALNNEKSSQTTEAAPEPEIETTELELQGYRIIQAILVQYIDLERITYRDAKTYFGVLLDDNNRKTICRLWFNRSQKYLGVFDADKTENKIPIDRIEEIYKYKALIIETAQRYDEQAQVA